MEVLTQVEVLNLRELENESDTSLFVLNNTQPRGEIIFNITTDRGRDHTVIVPDTWVPFDLSTQAKKSEVIGSPDFRKAITQKYILAVSTKSADVFLSSNEHATHELNRIFNKAGGQNSIANNATLASSLRPSKLEEIRQSVGGVAAISEISSSEESISGAVIQTISRSNTEGEEGMDVKEAIALLMGRKLNSKEYEYIIKSSAHDAIKAYASKQLAAMSPPVAAA